MKINGKPDGGGSAVITGLSIISNGIYTAGSGVDGYSPVTVSVPSREFVTETLSVTENGTYDPSSGVDGFSQVSVNVQPSLQDKTISINGSYTADQGYYGLSTVVVDVPPTIPVTEVLSVSDNGTYRPGAGVDGFSQVIVDVPQSVSGYTQKDITEGQLDIAYVNNNASFVENHAFAGNNTVHSVSLPMCNSVYTAAFYNCGGLNFVSLPICSNISYCAFGYCTTLSDIYIPECTYLSEQAFYACNSLSNIDLPKCSYVGNYAFYNTGLSYISLPSCEHIGEYVFYGCGSLKEVTLPVCSEIGWAAFYGCGSLSSISINSDCTISGYAFQNCGFVNLSTDLHSFINEGTFKENRKLLTAYLPECSSTVSGFFAECYSLMSVSMPKLTYISADTFNNCGSLETAAFDNVNFIGNSAFRGCITLSTVILRASSVCTLEDAYNVFYNTTPYLKVYVPSSLVESYKAADNWSNMQDQIYGLYDFSYSNGLVSGFATSMDSTYLTTLGISAADVTDVGMSFLKEAASSTFMNHTNLTTVSLPEVNEYKDDTFNGCSALTSMVLSVSALGDRVFANCTGLQTVDINYMDGVITTGSSIFDGCTALTSIYVAAQLYSDYLSASGWSEYSSLFVQKLPFFSFNDGLLYGYTSYIGQNSITDLGVDKTNVLSAYLPDCTYVDEYAFDNCPNLSNVSMEKVSYLGSYAFRDCPNLESAYFPECLEVKGCAFLHCNNCIEVNLSNCLNVQSGAIIVDNSYTTTVRLPMVSYLGIWWYNTALCRASLLSQVYLATDWYGVPFKPTTDPEFGETLLASGVGSIYVNHQNYSLFTTMEPWSQYSSLYVSVGDPNVPMLSYSNGQLYGVTKVIFNDFSSYLGLDPNSVTSVSLPECKIIAQSAFLHYDSLTTVDLSNCTMLQTSAFAECGMLETISLPECKYIAESVFQGAFQSNTTGQYISLNLPKCSYIGDRAFYWTQRSLTLILGYDSVVELGGGNVFDATTVQSVYVPASLVNTYKTEQNWQMYSDRIFAIQ